MDLTSFGITPDLIRGYGYKEWPLLNVFKTQLLSVERLKDIQRYFLKRIISEAYENIPYYTEIFNLYDIDPSAINDIEDLKILPVLNKDIIMRNPEKFRHKNLETMNYQESATGGSTGKTLEYRFNPEVYYYADSCLKRGFSWAGINFDTDPLAFFAGGSLNVKAVEVKGNKLMLPAVELTDENRLHEYYERIKQYKPKAMRVYPTAITVLCEFLQKNGLELEVPAIICTSETLFGYQRKLAEETLNARVFNEYGAYDGGAGAFECEAHTGMHLQMERGISEFYPSFTGSPEVKKLITTDLHNFVFPLIKYDVGDLVIPSENSQCECGRGLIKVKSIEGRTTDYIESAKGHKYPGMSVVHLFNKFTQEYTDAIKQYQFVQETSGNLNLYIIPGNNFTAETEQALYNYIKTRLSGFDLKIVKTESIPTPRSNKHRFVVNKSRKPAQIEKTFNIGKKAKPKILHIGGSHSIHIKTMAEEINKLGFDQIFYSYAKDDSIAQKLNSPFYYFPFRDYKEEYWRTHNLYEMLEKQLEEIIKKEKPDIVYAQSHTYSCVPAWLAKEKYGIPLMVFPWSLNTVKSPDPVANFFEAKCLNSADSIAVTTPGIYERFKNYYKVAGNKYFNFTGIPYYLLDNLRKKKLKEEKTITTSRMMGEFYKQDLLIEALLSKPEILKNSIISLLIGHSEVQGKPLFDKIREAIEKTRVKDNFIFIDRKLPLPEFQEHLSNNNVIYSVAAHDMGICSTNVYAAYSGAITIIQDEPLTDGVLDDEINVIKTKLDAESLAQKLDFIYENYNELLDRFWENNLKLKRFDWDIQKKVFSDKVNELA